ncbi:MAG: hypothetical protein ABW133_12375, partial [Polyangiaceae bacterium]
MIAIGRVLIAVGRVAPGVRRATGWELPSANQTTLEDAARAFARRLGVARVDLRSDSPAAPALKAGIAPVSGADERVRRRIEDVSGTREAARDLYDHAIARGVFEYLDIVDTVARNECMVADLLREADVRRGARTRPPERTRIVVEAFERRVCLADARRIVAISARIEGRIGALSCKVSAQLRHAGREWQNQRSGAAAYTQRSKNTFRS